MGVNVVRKRKNHSHFLTDLHISTPRLADHFAGSKHVSDLSVNRLQNRSPVSGAAASTPVPKDVGHVGPSVFRFKETC